MNELGCIVGIDTESVLPTLIFTHPMRVVYTPYEMGRPASLVSYRLINNFTWLSSIKVSAKMSVAPFDVIQRLRQDIDKFLLTFLN